MADLPNDQAPGDHFVPAENIAGLVVQAFSGEPRQVWVEATAIAMAESERRTVNGQTMYNLWSVGDKHLTGSKWGPSVSHFQIRTLRDGHPDKQREPWRDATALLEPRYATNTARLIWLRAGRSWRDWSTWPAAASQQMPAARRAVDKAAGIDADTLNAINQQVNAPGVDPFAPGFIEGAIDTVTGAVDNVTGGALAAAGQLLSALTQRKTWMRVAGVVGGIALIGVALMILARDLAGDVAREAIGG